MPERQPLVLLPGLLCDRRLWQKQISGLADLAAMDVADLTRAESIDAMADATLALAPPRFALAGLSMGGYVALAIMRRAPERVSRLALLDTSARADTPEQARKRREQMAWAREGRFEAVLDELLPMLVHPAHLAAAGIYRRMARALGPAVFVRQHSAMIGRPDSRPYLAAIACPTLVLCGRQDMRAPLSVHCEMAEAIPGACLEVIEDCGHLATLERPAEVTAAMRRWLLDQA